MKKKLKGICYPREKVGKLLLMTKLSFILTFFCLQIQANGFSQHTRLSIKLDNVSVKQLFVEIERLTDLAFVYNTNDVDQLGTVDVNFINEEIDKILDYCLKDKGVNYSFVNNHIVIKRADPMVPQQNQRKISGKVVDKLTGDPLPGTTIKIKGTNIGTAADVDGKFQLTVPADVDGLEVSFVGYETLNVALGKNNQLVLQLNPVVAEMQEVIVTGIFTRKAESYTGAINTIKAEELKRIGNQNIIQSLKSLDPGFQIVENMDFGSDPNRVPEIQMRGASNFSDMKNKYQTNPNQPLFIVDGFEQSIQKVLDMDMNRVATVTLIKDATAKALYGSKGANGVVVIETKAPDKGKMRVSYTGNLNIQAPDLSSYNLANAAEKLEIERRAGVYTSSYPPSQQRLDEAYNDLLAEVQRGVNTYWLSKPLRVGVGHKHTLNFEGGDDYIRYNVDFSYNKVDGVMKGSGRENISGGFMLSYRYKNFLFRDQLTVTFNKATDSPYGSFSEYARMNPYWRPYEDDGRIREVIGTYVNQNGFDYPIYNPLINASINTKYTNSYTDITNNLYAEWDAFKGLKLKARFGLVRNLNDSEEFLPKDHTTFRDITVESEDYYKRGSYEKGNGKNLSYDGDVSLNYNTMIGKHQILVNAMWAASQRQSEMVYFEAQGFGSNKMDYITAAKQYKENGSPYGSESLSREVSVLASANYAYDERYLFDISYRANASSLFGNDKRWGGFWSAGIGWNLHNEAFLKDHKIFNRVKLRASTGYSGSQNFNSYQAIATYSYNNEVVYDNVAGALLLGLANPDLQWQKTQDNNFGVDLTLANRLDLTFDYYIKNTKNLLSPITIPPSAGFTSYTENLGETQNKGFEARLNYRFIQNQEKDMYFSVVGSVMHNKNKIKKISNALNSLNDQNDADKSSGGSDHLEGKENVTRPSTRYQEGQSLDAIWAVRSLGIDPMNGNEVFMSLDGEYTYTWDAKNQVVCGDKQPKYTGSFGFNLDFKGFTLNTSFLYKLGGQYYNQTLVEKVENADVQYNVDRRMYTDRWTTPGVPAKFKKFGKFASFTRPTSRFIQDQNELQMTSLSVGYDFRRFNFVKTSAVKQLKLMFYMNDVFVASTVKTERGLEYPFARSFSFSVQATF